MYIKNSSLYADKVDIDLSGHKLVVLIDRKGENIPIAFDSAINHEENK